MRSKKIISILSAAAITASSMAYLTAFAADEVLYSDSFNGYETSGNIVLNNEGTPTADNETGSVFVCMEPTSAHTANAAEFGWMSNSAHERTLDKLTLGFTSNTCADTAVFRIYEKEDASDKYLSLTKSRDGHKAGVTTITGFDGYEANADEDLVIDFDVMFKAGVKDGAAVPVGLTLNGLTSCAFDSSALGTDTWVNVRLVSKDGSTTIYFDGEEYNTYTGTLSSIQTTPVTADTKCTLYGSANIDNLVIMSAADGSTAEVPPAEDHEQEATPTTDPNATIPPAAEIEDEYSFDFETDETSIDVTNVNTARGSVTVVDETDADAANVIDSSVNDAYAVKAVSTADNRDRYANFSINVSDYTTGKSHVILEYDSYIPTTGRMVLAVMDKAVSAYTDTGIFWQGTNSSNEYKVNGSVNSELASTDWVHTTVDIDLASGNGSYTVTGSYDTEYTYAEGTFTTTAQTVRSIDFISWSPNTSYIDNIKVSTGGTMDVVEPTSKPPVMTPGPVAKVEGSNIDLKPSDMRGEIGNMSAAEGTAEKVLNHSNAKTAVTATGINAYSTDYSGYSVYAAYDIYVAAGDSFNLTAYGDSGKAAGSQFIITGNDDGTATVNATGDKGESIGTYTIPNQTWYRVVVEVPMVKTQISEDESATYTGNSTYTIYNINVDDCTKTDGIAAQITDITPRNLYNRGLTSFNTTVTGTPYIDNGVIYFAATTLPEVKPEITISADLTTATSSAASDDVVILKASYSDDGRLTSVESITGVAEGDNTLNWETAPVEGDKVIALSSISDIEPLLEEAAGLTTAAE